MGFTDVNEGNVNFQAFGALGEDQGDVVVQESKKSSRDQVNEGIAILNQELASNPQLVDIIGSRRKDLEVTSLLVFSATGSLKREGTKISNKGEEVANLVPIPKNVGYTLHTLSDNPIPVSSRDWRYDEATQSWVFDMVDKELAGGGFMHGSRRDLKALLI